MDSPAGRWSEPGQKSRRARWAQVATLWQVRQLFGPGSPWRAPGRWSVCRPEVRGAVPSLVASEQRLGEQDANQRVKSQAGTSTEVAVEVQAEMLNSRGLPLAMFQLSHSLLCWSSLACRPWMTRGDW